MPIVNKLRMINYCICCTVFRYTYCIYQAKLYSHDISHMGIWGNKRTCLYANEQTFTPTLPPRIPPPA